MSIKKCFMLVISLTTFLGISAKNAGDVSATLKDSKTKEPIAYASVELLNSKDSLLTGCITDSKGYFELAPPATTSKIRIRFMGYKNMEMAFNDRDLNVVYMEEEARQLNEVNIKGSARQNKIDRDVYTITKSMRDGTTSSQELLGKLNGVHYNVYDKSISVNGSTNVLILVDGIEKDQQFAKNLQPERIERVEVIKDPVGKYATDGYSAVINIVLKKDYSGIDASISNTVFFDIIGMNGDDFLAQNYANLNVNYTNKNLNIYTSGSQFTGNYNLPAEYIKQYGNRITKSQPMDINNPNVSVKPRNSNLALGADYTFNKKHTLSTELKYTDNFLSNSNAFDLTNYLNDVVTSTSYSQNETKDKTTNLQVGLTYKGKFDDKNSLNADVRYYRTDGYNYSYYVQDNFKSESDIDLSGDYIRSNVNFIHTFSPKISLDLGYGNVYFTNTNTLNLNSFTRYNYRNRVSLYASYRPFEKLNTKLGGIVENYTQKYQNESKNLTVFLPYANIQYIANPKFNIVARYQSNAQYPTINQLNPYKMAIDSLMYSAGKPGLNTGINNTIGLDFNIMNAITLSPYYTFNNSYLSTFVGIDPDNANYYLTQSVNAEKYEQYGVRLNFTIPFSKKFFWQNNINWSESKISYLNESNMVDNWRINSNLIYVEPSKGLVAGLIYQKQTTKNIIIQGYNSNDNDLVLAMLRKSFFKEKLNVSLYYVAPINIGLTYDLPNTTKATGYYNFSTSRMSFIKNLTFIEVSYNLSAGKKTKKQQVSTDDEFNSGKKGGFGL